MLEKIKEFYRPELSKHSSSTFILNIGDKKKYLTFHSTEKLYLTFGIPAKTAEEAITNGAYVTTPQELGKQLFPEAWGKVSKKILPDQRTVAYLNKIKENNGLIESKYETEGDGLKFDKKEEIEVWINASPVWIGCDDEGNWIAEYSLRTDIDSYYMADLIFNRKPTKKMIKTVSLIEDIETYFKIHGWDKVSFTCWECGCKMDHWLDIEGSLETKWDSFNDKYCGC